MNQSFAAYNTSTPTKQNMEEAIEAPITNIMVARFFEDGSHRGLMTGHLIFNLRSQSSNSGLDTVVTLGRLNLLLRQGYLAHSQTFSEQTSPAPNNKNSNIKFISEERLAGGLLYDTWKSRYIASGASMGTHDYKLSGQPQNVFTDDLRATIKATDSTKDAYARGIAPNALQYIREKCIKTRNESSKQYKDEIDSLRFFSEHLIDSDVSLKYLYGHAIMGAWNFAGVIRSSTGDDNGYGKGPEHNRNMMGPGLSVTTHKKCQELKNYWRAGLNVGDLLWLILKRIKDPKTGKYEAFQFVPFSDGIHPPTVDDLYYKDISGTTAIGAVIYVGKVSELPYGQISQAVRDAAAGINVNLDNWKDIFDASAKLDNLVCHVRI